MGKPLLSIAVPTKDRYPYLYKLIDLVESFHSEDIELVIQDNSEDNTEFAKYIENKQCAWIVYNHIAGQIPMATNSDYAILNSNGEYVCFIGDDDGVTRYIVDCVKWMKANNVDAVLPASVSYNWPDIKSAKGFDNSSQLYYKPFSSKIYRLNPEEELMKVLKTGFKDRGMLPMVYHGIVSRRCLDKVYEIGHTFFPANSPDISNAVSLSFIVKEFYGIDYPITISGASKYHGGGAGLVKKRFPELTDISWFLPNGIKDWEPTVPAMGVGDSIWPESGIKALRYNSREDLIEHVNFDALYSRFIAYTYPLRSMALDLCKNKCKVKMMAYKLIVLRYVNAIIRLVFQKFGLKPGYEIKTHITDIQAAEQSLADMQLLMPFKK